MTKHPTRYSSACPPRRKASVASSASRCEALWFYLIRDDVSQFCEEPVTRRPIGKQLKYYSPGFISYKLEAHGKGVTGQKNASSGRIIRGMQDLNIELLARVKSDNRVP